MLENLVPLAKAGAVALVNDDEAKEITRDAAVQGFNTVVGVQGLVERKVKIAVEVQLTTLDETAWVRLAVGERCEGAVSLIAQNDTIGQKQDGFP